MSYCELTHAGELLTHGHDTDERDVGSLCVF
jgi:hypothetical protein